MFVFLTFLTFKFWFHYLYILELLFGKPKLGSSTIGQFGKTAFTVEFLTAANTLTFLQANDLNHFLS